MKNRGGKNVNKVGQERKTGKQFQEDFHSQVKNDKARFIRQRLDGKAHESIFSSKTFSRVCFGQNHSFQRKLINKADVRKIKLKAIK